MKVDSRGKSLVLALVGILSVAIYFWLFAQSKAVHLLRTQVPKAEIMAKAEQAYKGSPLGEYDWPSELQVRVDDDLFRYVQTSPKGELAKSLLPIGEWEISWHGKAVPHDKGPVVVDIDADKKKEMGRFTVKYDLNGKLQRLEQVMPQPPDSSNLAEPVALQKAQEFLVALDIDTAAIQLAKREAAQESNLMKYSYTFKRTSPSADWDESYLVRILGSTVTLYQAGVELHKDISKRSKFEEVSEVVMLILTILIWVSISILILITFFRRLRHDELEFKRAVWVGIAIGLAMWCMIAIQSWDEWEGVLLGGGFGGLFTGAGILLVYAATESLQREVWKEKLAQVDLLFRGYARVNETGHALLRSFFIAGVTLLVVGGVTWLATHFNLAALKIDEDDLWVFQDQYHIIAALSLIIVNSTYIALIFLAFLPAYVRAKTFNLQILLLIVGLFFGLSGLSTNFLKPGYFSFILFLPAAFLWAWFVYRYDLLTMWLALLAVQYFLNFSMLVLLPEGFSSSAGITTAVLSLAFLAAGIYLVYSKNSARDFEHYVPAYVSRIAERERFLKELEIARSIQMRFLPAKPPVFPKLDIACLCKPAMEVGGDYYDFIQHGNSRLGVVIGDVSGKGVSAAFFMTMAKGIIKALSRINPSPKSLLSDMNTVFYENTPKEVFISLIYGFFDVDNNTLIFARAGHNPLIVRKSVGGAPELLNPRGLAIGMERGPIFSSTIEERAVPIQSGDVFIFYTDGISEAMNKNGDEFGEDRLSQLVSQHARESAQTILDKITHDVTHFANGAKQHDDFTMVVVKVVG